MSSSQFDPEQKSATSKVSSVDRSLKVGGRHRVAVIVATVLERVRRPAGHDGPRIYHIARYREIAVGKSQLVPCLTSQLVNK